jgi:hypothetical protein
MVMHRVTVDLPDWLYAMLEQRATDSRSSIQQQLLALLSANVAGEEGDRNRIRQVLDGMQSYSDSDLLGVIQMKPSKEGYERSEFLNDKQRDFGMTPSERVELESLLTEFDWHMLLRGKALALLHQRGHDIQRLLADSVPMPT